MPYPFLISSLSHRYPNATNKARYTARWWGLVGLLPLVTVAMSWCPAYSIFGLKTNKGD
ncbi:MAG TPA: DUF2892 domain-containing protein [Gammaproteobacteria bacterium]|nr:DUF2892 domain-containing protein [Gammaproteobacteria bacterium]